MALLGSGGGDPRLGFNGPAIGFIALLSFLMGATVSVRLRPVVPAAVGADARHGLALGRARGLDPQAPRRWPT